MEENKPFRETGKSFYHLTKKGEIRETINRPKNKKIYLEEIRGVKKTTIKLHFHIMLFILQSIPKISFIFVVMTEDRKETDI